MFAPYFTHVLEAWSQRNHPNMLFLFYEDLKKVLKKFKFIKNFNLILIILNLLKIRIYQMKLKKWLSFLARH